jgi:peptidoglycan LD-endopeptidase CwlK
MILKKYSKERLLTLRPDFADVLTELLKLCHTAGLDMQISSGYRSVEEQNALYSIGRTRPGKIVTNAKGGQSKHQQKIAADLFFLVDGKASFDAKLYRQMWKIAVANSLDKKGLLWAGNWKTFKEMAHVEFAK